MADLFENMPPAGITLPDVEDEIDALNNRQAYIEHDLQHTMPQGQDALKLERYENNKRLAELQGWIDNNLI